MVLGDDLVQEGEQNRDDDGCLGGLTEDNKENGDGEVVRSAHGECE